MAGMQTHDPVLSVDYVTNDLTKYDINSQIIVISLLIVVTFSAVVLNCRSVKQLHTSEAVKGLWRLDLRFEHRIPNIGHG